MAIQRLYKISLGLIELSFAIPILGGAIILAHAWTPLTALVILHALGICFSHRDRKSKAGHMLGAVGNLIAFIPVVGWLVHAVVGITLLIQGLMDK